MKKKESALSVFELTMMAVGTVIGGSFFLGSAISIKSAGPSVILAYILGGGLVYLILYALSEMTVADADPGSFRTFAHRAFGPSVGFTVGWVYWTGLILAMSSEAVAVSLFLKNWYPNLSIPITGALIIGLVTIANLFGADRLSKLESSLASIKIIAIAGFIAVALFLVLGILPGKPAVGTGVLGTEPVMPGGIGGFAGSMLIVMFAYAGFEVIGLAASETAEPQKIVPRAIVSTVLILTFLYIGAIALFLPLFPTGNVSQEVSPFVAALGAKGIGWAASVINIVLVTAILSTMLAATFGLGRMIRSLADEHHAPKWLCDEGDVPYRGILFSGTAMLAGLAMSFVLPKQVYLFLVSSGGYSLLFTYLIILLTHYKFRKGHGCPPKGKCQFPFYPYTSWIAIIALIAIIISMPLIPGQGLGLAAGILLTAFFFVFYDILEYAKKFKLARR